MSKHNLLGGLSMLVLLILAASARPAAAQTLDPAACLGNLSQATRDAPLPQGLENSLLTKIDGARSMVLRGNFPGATNHLGAYQNEVAGLAGKRLTTADAERLTRGADTCIGAFPVLSIPITGGKNTPDNDYGYTIDAFDLKDMANVQHFLIVTRFRDGLSFRQDMVIGDDRVRINTTLPRTGETRSSEISAPQMAAIPKEQRIYQMLIPYITAMRFAYPNVRGALMALNLPQIDTWQPVVPPPPPPTSCDEARKVNADFWANAGVNCFCKNDGTCWCDGKRVNEPYEIETQECPEQQFASGILYPVSAAQYGEPSLHRVAYGGCNGQDWKCSSGAPQENGFYYITIDYKSCCLEHDRAFYCGGDSAAFGDANAKLVGCTMQQVSNAFDRWVNENWGWFLVPVAGQVMFLAGYDMYINLLWAACKMFSMTGAGAQSAACSFLQLLSPSQLFLNIITLGIYGSLLNAPTTLVAIGMETTNYMTMGWPRTGGCDEACNPLPGSSEPCDRDSCTTAKARQKSCLCKKDGLPVPACNDMTGCIVNDCSERDPIKRVSPGAWKNLCGPGTAHCRWTCERCVENRPPVVVPFPQANVTAEAGGKWSAVAGPMANATFPEEKVIECGWKVLMKTNSGWVADDGTCAANTSHCEINCCPTKPGTLVAEINPIHGVVSLTQVELDTHIKNNTPIIPPDGTPIPIPRPPDLPPTPIRPVFSGVLTEQHPAPGYFTPWQVLAPQVSVVGTQQAGGAYAGTVSVHLSAATPGSTIYCRTDGVVPHPLDANPAQGGSTQNCTDKTLTFGATTRLIYQAVRPGFEPKVGEVYLRIAP